MTSSLLSGAKVCDNSHCGEKKHCVPYLDAFKCACPRGYYGKDCELSRFLHKLHRIGFLICSYYRQVDTADTDVKLAF